MALQPINPGSAHIPGKNELVPQIDQLIGANEAANVIRIALTEDLLVHAGALLAIRKVVAAIRTAPTNMQRQFHHTSDLVDICDIKIIRHGGNLSSGSCQPVHSRLSVASSPAAAEQERVKNTHRRIHGTHTIPERQPSTLDLAESSTLTSERRIRSTDTATTS